MSPEAGSALLGTAATRIIARYLFRIGCRVSLRGTIDAGSSDADLTYWKGVQRLGAKVKADPYFGRDRSLIGDWEMPFYRQDTGTYAFETISHTVTRQPGWVFSSTADQLFYYFLALHHTEEELRALLSEPDPVFFDELKVGRDELHVIPMPALRDWFERQHEHYPPRPVKTGDHSAWYRLIPRQDIERAVPGIEVPGPIFAFAASAAK